ncbi:hypothetical protein H7F50_17870 [Novosphingobium flavum]|uniref:Uncharacterized protein n=1 Tax=Novosphingobium aerophilum TaxID=2839843 RepID=A0A7X1FB12_9SPHN|nr:MULTISPECIES: hypothetical protein [Novosphingobium]MBC2653695.1 hypothetical protein [Novosphingobium aerophilum]MBC2663609.1 hypothetical protein [Novosphingobium aerophilum]
MKALTQCWFTRVHIPESRAHKEPDGTLTSYCRHCDRPIMSWDRHRWFLADGFNVTQLAETVSGRFLVLLDSVEETIIGRWSVQHIEDAAELEAFKRTLCEQHGVGQPGATLELYDSGDARDTRAKAKRAATRRAPGGTARLSASY